MAATHMGDTPQPQATQQQSVNISEEWLRVRDQSRATKRCLAVARLHATLVEMSSNVALRQQRP